jgi:hypothetical protein
LEKIRVFQKYLPRERSKRGQETTIVPKTGDLVGLSVEIGLPGANFKIAAGWLTDRVGFIGSAQESGTLFLENEISAPRLHHLLGRYLYPLPLSSDCGPCALYFLGGAFSQVWMVEEMKIVILILVLLLPVIGSAEDLVYDQNWNLQYRIDNGRIYDKNWQLKGYIQDGKIYDNKWQLKGRIEEGKSYDKIYAPSYKLKGYRQGDRLYDQAWTPKGYSKGKAPGGGRN